MRILYIDIDSCRPDHLGCYGYHRNTSPQIDAIAADGVRLEQCYTSDAPCLPSRTALYSGRFGIQTGVVGHGFGGAEPRREGLLRGFQDRFETQGLAHQLQELGFHTAMFSPFAQRHSAHWFCAGFNEVHNTGKRGMESAEEIWPALEKWLAGNAADDKWYLHVNFWDPHMPYRVPMSFGDPFAGAPLPAHLDDDGLIARHRKLAGLGNVLANLATYDPAQWPRMLRQVTNRADMRKWIDGYDTAILYADLYIGKIVAALKRLGIYEDTAIIISADHGECEGELGIYGDHATADAVTCRVPLIIKWPGGQRGIADRAFHYSLDLCPTLMELLGGASPSIWDGQSYAPTIRSAASAGREELVLGQCAHVCQRSVRWANWLYMRTYHDGFRAFPQEMVFDLVADPYEQHDLAPSHPDICREGLWRLNRWQDAQMQKLAADRSAAGGDVEDPLWRVIRDGGPWHASPRTRPPNWFAQYLHMLEQTGRAQPAAVLRARYPNL